MGLDLTKAPDLFKGEVTGFFKKHFMPSRRPPPAIKGGVYEMVEAHIHLDSDPSQRVAFQTMPDEIPDSKSANWNRISPWGRGEPYRVYSGSDSRTINLELEFFVSTDYLDEGTLDFLRSRVNFLRSLVYPESEDANSGIVTHPPVVWLLVGDLLNVRAVVTNCSVRWKGPWRTISEASVPAKPPDAMYQQFLGGIALAAASPVAESYIQRKAVSAFGNTAGQLVDLAAQATILASQATSDDAPVGPPFPQFSPHAASVTLALEEVNDIVPTSYEIRQGLR